MWCVSPEQAASELFMLSPNKERLAQSTATAGSVLDKMKYNILDHYSQASEYSAKYIRNLHHPV